MQQLPVIQPRPIDSVWKCKRSNECCTLPAEVVLTKQEAVLLMEHAPAGTAMQFRPINDGGTMLGMKAQPCPLFQNNECSVYEFRPMNCRRFLCLRPDPASEPFELNDANAGDRIAVSRTMRRLYERNQRKAQQFGLKHGWSA